jgi:hypothetical protein
MLTIGGAAGGTPATDLASTPAAADARGTDLSLGHGRWVNGEHPDDE